MRLKVADVFAGCGGLSHGFSRSGLFDVVLGTDIDEVALETFAFNHSRSGVAPVTVSGDIRKISPKDLRQRLEPLGLESQGALDVLMGGPPCEGFSQNRRHEIVLPNGERVFTRNPLDSRDPRNELFRYFLSVVGEMRPKAVLIENVPQMVTSHGGGIIREISATLAKWGYTSSWRVLNATHYGVPQARRRAFLVATSEGMPEFEWPDATHGDAPLKPVVTVRDAIGDLPVATDNEIGRRTVSRYGAPSDFGRLMQSRSSTPMNQVRRIPGERVLERLRSMRPGMIAADMPEELKPKSQYYNAYGRLSWDKPAKTITKSCNYLGSGCFGHPVEDRGITMREAARLQSFDDDFEFLTASQPHVAKMVGSAVPPLLAAALAESLAKSLLAEASGRTEAEAREAAA